jgi:hypothetical protein
VAKLLVRYPTRRIGAVMCPILAWGDFIMMRKQLLTFKYLAEQQTEAASKETLYVKSQKMRKEKAR